MFSDRLRRRLEALDRDPSSFSARTVNPQGAQTNELREAVVTEWDTPDEPLAPMADDRFSASWDEATPFVARASESHATHLPGREVETAWGKHWLIQQSIEAVWPLCGKYLDQSLAARVAQVQHDDLELRELAMKYQDRILLLDLETCGLAGSMIFLIGLVHYHDGQLVLSQLWARDYAEEKAILQSLWNLAQGEPVLVTFNGKSFDWPQVHDRSTLHLLGQRVDDGGARCIPMQLPTANKADDVASHEALQPADPRPELIHVDLLHHARRRWRSQLPNCRLQTLERYICGRRRVGDLPGSEIPDAYHDYVRTGSLRDVHAILHHNALDLVTLLQLAIVFVQEASSERPRPT